MRGVFWNEKLEAMQLFLCVLGDSDEKMKFEDNLKGLQKGKVFFDIHALCMTLPYLILLIHAPIFVSRKRGGDV